MLADITTFNLSEPLAFVATITALGAFVIAWHESQRNNKVIIKLKRLDASMYETDHGNGYHLEVCVVNCGIQLQNVEMFLRFCGQSKGSFARFHTKLSESDSDGKGSFPRGSIAEFVLTRDPPMKELSLLFLKDIKEQGLQIILCNNSFPVAFFSMWSRWDKLKRLWNSIRILLHDGLKRQSVINPNTGTYVAVKGLFKIKSDTLQFFIDGINKDLPSGIHTAIAQGHIRC